MISVGMKRLSVLVSLALLLNSFLWSKPLALPDSVAPSAPPATGVSSTAQNQPEVRVLESGKAIEREMAGGQSHFYQVTLTTGQYLSVVVEQRGIDVVVRLFAPDGKQLLEVDSPNGDQGPEPLAWIAELAGAYRLEVLSPDKNAKAGRYEAKLIELRPATPSDRAQIEKALALSEATQLNAEVNKLREAGQYDKALPLAARALAIREKALGAEHPDTAFALDKLAALYHRQGDYAKAEPLYQRALAIFEKVLGAEHPSTAASLNNLAALYEDKGDVTQAIALRSRASAIEERNIALNTRTGSERQKAVYLATLTGNSEDTVSLHARSAPHNAAARDLALTVILQRKGRALDAMTDSIAALRRRASAPDQALLDQLQEAQSQHSRLVLNGPQQTTLATPAEHQARIKIAAEEVEKLEAEVSRRSAEFRAQSQPVTIAAVQAAIPAEAALVEFFSYHPYNAKDRQLGARRYIAYMLRQQGAAQWVDLGTTKRIDEAAAKLRRALRDRKRQDVKLLAREVDRLVMQPLRPLLGKTRRVLLSPDGALNLVPFAALVDEQNRYLVNRYEFSYLTSGRDLLRLQVKQESKQENGQENGQGSGQENRQSAMIIANPDFGEAAKDGQAQKRGLKLMDRPSTGAGTEASTKAGTKADTKVATGEGAVLADYYFPPLAGTADEAQALKAMMSDATVLVQAQATKAALKRIEHPRLLHIATHGFFLENQSPAATEGRGLKLMPVGGAEPAGGRIENPLLRSGLALAGANLHQDGDDDGILTALEVAGLDLWGTKLVVLSACDTGVGEIKTGEGVYGLRRALVLAGSETQVMSLWPVSDRGTRDLMIAYYTALQQGAGRSEALRQVQLRMLRNQNYSHPYYWASFIQSGEWASLVGRR